MGRWVWIEDHWNDVVPYGIAASLLLIFFIGAAVFWFKVPEPVELYTTTPQIIVLQAPEDKRKERAAHEHYESQEEKKKSEDEKMREKV
jgi:hypothetical protein